MPFASGVNGERVHQLGPQPSATDYTDRPFPNNGFNHNTAKYSSEPRPFKVIGIGAGFSGVYLGVKLPMVCPEVELVIYEKNDAIGGTWYENRYPGAACDVPAHRYAYQFELNPNWSAFYAGSDEIRDYIESTAKKYGATDYIKMRHQVTAARWNEDDGLWNVTVKDPDGKEFKESANLLVNAAGALNNWKWPDIPGREDFKGAMLHSAAYDRSYDYEGKRVAVIGSGSSSIQIVPTLQPEVKHLGVHMRSNTWIIPPMNESQLKMKSNGEFDFLYTLEEIEKFRADPHALLQHRQNLEKDVSAEFHIYLKNNPLQEKFRTRVAHEMEKRLTKKPELIEKVIPGWYVGCKRGTPGIGYLESLAEDNAEVIFDTIERFTEKGIRCRDGKEYEYDAIVCATGFNVSHVPRFELIGRDGFQVGDSFAENPYGYMAVAMQGFPNYFLFNGPNAPIGQGSLVPASEQQGDYICKIVEKMRTQDIKTMQITDESIEHFTRYVDRWMEDAVWSGGCRSWYKNHSINGRVTALWGGSGLHFIEALENPRWEDYMYTYMDPVCKYSFFNSGFTKVEKVGGNRNRHMLSKVGAMKDHPRLSREDREEKYRDERAALQCLNEDP